MCGPSPSRGHAATSAPSSRTTPATGFHTPTMRRASVDFPEALGPMSAERLARLQGEGNTANDRLVRTLEGKDHALGLHPALGHR